MKVTQKLISLSLSGALTVGLLLSLTVGALAATQPFTLLGALVDLGGGAWSVQGVEFVVDSSTACFESDGVTPLDCATLTGGVLVEVVGTYDDAADPIVRTATTITLQDGSKTYTFTGLVEEITADYWMVGGFKFWIQTDTVLPADFYGLGDTVEVTFVLSTDPATLGEYLAKSITVLESAASYTYTGILTAASGEAWTVGDYDFFVPMAVQPPFFAVNDEVEVTFTISGGVNTATQVVVLNSGDGNFYTFEGMLSGLSDDHTVWSVTDDAGNTYDFLVSADLFPIYFGLQDRVRITFSIVNQQNVAAAVEVVQTFVPIKTESERCMNRVKDHPALVKLAAQVGVDPEVLLEYFCKGFGVGEIKLAFKHAENSQYTAEMLLAMRAQGASWGELKKLSNAAPEEGETEESQNGKPENPNKPDKPPKPEKPAKPETPANSNKPDKPETPANSNQPDKPEKPDKPDKPGKP